MEKEETGPYSRTFAYVTSSRYRQKVLEHLAAGPKRPKGLAAAIDVGLPHVSRALRELGLRGLAVCLDERLPKARRYQLTEAGHTLAQVVAKTKGTLGVVPMARGTHVYNHLRSLRRRFGEESTQKILRDAEIEEPVDPTLWYPVKMALDLFEAMERNLGDGSYDLVRRQAADVVDDFPSVKQLLSRLLPMEFTWEMAPAAYAKEFNHGRIEVEVEEGRVRLYNYDWVSSRARCADWQGTYEGILKVKGLRGKVTKFKCIRSGDDCCAYLVEWE